MVADVEDLRPVDDTKEVVEVRVDAERGWGRGWVDGFNVLFFFGFVRVVKGPRLIYLSLHFFE